MKIGIKKILVGILLLILFSALVSLLQKNSTLKSQLGQTRQMLVKVEENAKRLDEEKKGLLKEKDKMQQDMTSYLDMNSDLQKDKEALQKTLEDDKAGLKKISAELLKSKATLERLRKQAVAEKRHDTASQKKQEAQLSRQISALEENLRKERAVYHYNLAVSYSQAKLYDDAITSYEKSLSFDDTNAEAHYNLGLLYGNRSDTHDKAIEHYRRYLQLSPDADDRDEVERWIKALK